MQRDSLTWGWRAGDWRVSEAALAWYSCSGGQVTRLGPANKQTNIDLQMTWQKDYQKAPNVPLFISSKKWLHTSIVCLIEMALLLQ